MVACPAGISFEERTRLAGSKPSAVGWWNRLTAGEGTLLFDYGNAFSRKSAYEFSIKEIRMAWWQRLCFIWPSYVEDIMGTYALIHVMVHLLVYRNTKFWLQLTMQPWKSNSSSQDRDNYNWVEKNQLWLVHKHVSSSRLHGPCQILLKFTNSAKARSVSMTTWPPRRIWHDAPFRETSNTRWFERHQTWFTGNAARGMSLAALHNGGTGIVKLSTVDPLRPPDHEIIVCHCLILWVEAGIWVPEPCHWNSDRVQTAPCRNRPYQLFCI